MFRCHYCNDWVNGGRRHLTHPYHIESANRHQPAPQGTTQGVSEEHRQREPRTRVRSDSEHPLGREVGECAREVTESRRREELEIVTALDAGKHAVQVWKDDSQLQNSSSAGVDESPRGKLAWYRMDADLKSFKEDLNIQ